MIREFNASIIDNNKDEQDILIIGFAENEAFENYVLIQFSEDLDEQDSYHNWTKYYLEVSGLGGAYACLSKVFLNKEKIIFTLNNKGVKKFHLETIEIGIVLSTKKWEHLKNTLSDIFKDYNLFFHL